MIITTVHLDSVGVVDVIVDGVVHDICRRGRWTSSKRHCRNDNDIQTRTPMTLRRRWMTTMNVVGIIRPQQWSYKHTTTLDAMVAKSCGRGHCLPAYVHCSNKCTVITPHNSH